MYLSREEELELCRRARNGDIEARNKAVMNIYDWIANHARKMAANRRSMGRQNVDIDDLIQAGMQLVLNKFHLFNPENGYSLGAYFTIGILQAMVIQADKTVIRVPRIEGKPNSHLHEYAKKARDVVAFSQLSKDRNNALQMAMSMEECRDIQIDIGDTINNIQPKRLARILRMHCSGRTLAEIGKKMKVSKERIRQLLIVSIRKFREQLPSY